MRSDGIAPGGRLLGSGRQRTSRSTTTATTLLPRWYCSTLIRQFGISNVVVGKAVSYIGG